MGQNDLLGYSRNMRTDLICKENLFQYLQYRPHSANGTIRDVVAGVAVVHSAFNVEVVTAVAEGRVERCYNITIRQFTCCVNAHLLLLECVENSNLQFKMFSLAFVPFSAMSFVKKRLHFNV